MDGWLTHWICIKGTGSTGFLGRRLKWGYLRDRTIPSTHSSVKIKIFEKRLNDRGVTIFFFFSFVVVFWVLPHHWRFSVRSPVLYLTDIPVFNVYVDFVRIVWGFSWVFSSGRASDTNRQSRRSWSWPRTSHLTLQKRLYINVPVDEIERWKGGKCDYYCYYK